MAQINQHMRRIPSRCQDMESCTIDTEADSVRNDSVVGSSPITITKPVLPRPPQYRILPPSITGHGRLIVAHRVVPYWIGVMIVLGAFAWAVWCAVFVYPLLGGHANEAKLDKEPAGI